MSLFWGVILISIISKDLLKFCNPCISALGDLSSENAKGDSSALERNSQGGRLVTLLTVVLVLSLLPFFRSNIVLCIHN